MNSEFVLDRLLTRNSWFNFLLLCNTLGWELRSNIQLVCSMSSPPWFATLLTKADQHWCKWILLAMGFTSRKWLWNKKKWKSCGQCRWCEKSPWQILDIAQPRRRSLVVRKWFEFVFQYKLNYDVVLFPRLVCIMWIDLLPSQWCLVHAVKWYCDYISYVTTSKSMHQHLGVSKINHAAVNALSPLLFIRDTVTIFCLENLEMSGNYTDVREMSVISVKGSCHGKTLLVENCPKAFLKIAQFIFLFKKFPSWRQTQVVKW